MSALPSARRRRRTRAGDLPPVDGLIVSGLAELALGAWTNAMSFGVLTAWPDLESHPAYRAGVVGSFVATSTGFVGLAAEGARRWRSAR